MSPRPVQALDSIMLPQPIPPERRVRATRYIVHDGVHLAAAGQVLDSSSGLAKAIAAGYPDALLAAEDKA